MKKQFLNLGKALNKAEQKEINGGGFPCISRCDLPLNCCDSEGVCGLRGENGRCYTM